jgi:hypothetical protein
MTWFRGLGASHFIEALIETLEKLGRLIIVLTGLILLWLTAWYIIQAKAASLNASEPASTVEEVEAGSAGAIRALAEPARAARFSPGTSTI